MKKIFFMLITTFCVSALIAQPTGTIISYAGKAIPAGWDLCDGKEVNKTEAKYVNLFKAIGNTWGGNGNPNFKLPDLKGQFLMGAPATNEVSNSGGSVSHDHGGWTGNARGDAYGIRDGGDNPPAATGFGSQHSINSAENLPPYKKVLYLIKL